MERVLEQWAEAEGTMGPLGHEVDRFMSWVEEQVLGPEAGTASETEAVRGAVLRGAIARVVARFALLEAAGLADRMDALAAQVEEALEGLAEPVLIIGIRRGRIRWANKAARSVVGSSGLRLKTMTLAQVTAEGYGGQLRRMREQAVAEGRARVDTLPVRGPDGSVRNYGVEATLICHRGEPVLLCVLQPVGEGDGATRVVCEPGVGGGEVERLQRFLENVFSALPIRLVVVDSQLRVMHANPAFYVQRGMARDEVVGHSVDEVLPRELLEEGGLRAAIQSVLESGERVRWSGYRDTSSRQGERVLNVRLDPCEGPDGDRAVLITLEDVTERQVQVFGRTVLQQISRALLGELSLPRLLYAILTGMTAGGAVGLGFNRAILLLVDEEEGVLRAEMAVGPETAEEAAKIWSEVGEDYQSLEDFLANYDKLPPPSERPLRSLVEQLVFPLTDTEHVPMLALTTGQTVHILDAETDRRVPPMLRELLKSDEFVVAPLIARGKSIGVAIADNLFTQRPISQAAIQLLTALADQAALAVASARMYARATEDATRLDEALHQLEAAQEERLRTEKLAAVGEVAAIVAHEIRSPLSAIGGFARSIMREPEQVERNARSAKIIVEEVQRLERILAELLDFTKPSEPQLGEVDLRPLLESVAEKARQAPETHGVEIRVVAEEDVATVTADERHVVQILHNLVNNAIQAMPRGGTVTLRLRKDSDRVCVDVEDTGEGIPQDRLERIFDAFYTSKPSGTGLGLALCKKLAAQQGAEITVQSQEGVGTTFTLVFGGTQQADHNSAAQRNSKEGQ
jgi:PAS domain S-box-containing protein